MKVCIGNLLGAMYHSTYMLSQQPSEVGTVPFMGGKLRLESCISLPMCVV